MKRKRKPPTFVIMGGTTAMRLYKGKYYRDAGDWSVGYKYVDGKLLSWHWPNMRWLHRVELTAITYEEWAESNRGYAPFSVTSEYTGNEVDDSRWSKYEGDEIPF